jgi:O-antigen ligase
VVAGWDSLMTFKRDKELDAELTAESAKLRPVLATVAWHMFQDRPLLGFGFGQYKEVMPDYLADRTTDLPLEKARPFVQHNVFLAILTDTGLVGLTLWLAVLTGWTWYGWQIWRASDLPTWTNQLGLLFLAAVGIYVPNGLFHDVSIVAMVNMLLFFLAGAAVGLALSSQAVARARAQRNLTWTPSLQPSLATR